IITNVILLSSSGYSAYNYYCGIFFLGIGTGLWALTVTTTAEQFGTDIRATVTTSVPNFVRVMVIPLTMAFQFLQTYFSVQYAALIIICMTLVFALIVLYSLNETFYRNLDFYEAKN
ncbi:MAG: MFS transporter, partial [Gammaproteobacteria bacterium]